jgi:hypothetical protein
MLSRMNFAAVLLRLSQNDPCIGVKGLTLHHIEAVNALAND